MRAFHEQSARRILLVSPSFVRETTLAVALSLGRQSILTSWHTALKITNSRLSYNVSIIKDPCSHKDRTFKIESGRKSKLSMPAAVDGDTGQVSPVGK